MSSAVKLRALTDEIKQHATRRDPVPAIAMSLMRGRADRNINFGKNNWEKIIDTMSVDGLLHRFVSLKSTPKARYSINHMWRTVFVVLTLTYVCTASGAKVCQEAGSCEACRARGCAWCRDKCVGDAVGNCPRVEHIGHAADTWQCPASTRTGPVVQECLLMAVLGRFDGPLQQSARRIPTGGWLQHRMQGAAWAHHWCLIQPSANGTLRCFDEPSGATAANISLAACHRLGPSKHVSPLGGKAMELRCGSAQHLISGVDNDSQKRWIAALLSVVAAKTCEGALAGGALSRYEEGSAQLLTAVLWSRVGFHDAAVPYWQAAALLQPQNQHVRAAAGWAVCSSALLQMAHGKGADAAKMLALGGQLLRRAVLPVDGRPGLGSHGLLALVEAVKMLMLAGADSEALQVAADIIAAVQASDANCWDCLLPLLALRRQLPPAAEAFLSGALREHEEALEACKVGYSVRPSSWAPRRLSSPSLVSGIAEAVDSMEPALWTATSQGTEHSCDALGVSQAGCDTAAGTTTLLRALNWSVDLSQPQAFADASHSIVAVELLGPGHTHAGSTSMRAVKLMMPLHDALALQASIANTGSQWVAYINVGHSEGPSVAYHPPLDTWEAALPMPAVTPPGGMLQSANLWMGNTPIAGALHADPDHNMLVVLAGNKTVQLYSPSQIGALCPTHPPTEVSPEGTLRWDSGAVTQNAYFSLGGAQPCRDATPHKVVVPAGSLLLIPRGWFHKVDSVAAAGHMHIAVNFWFG